MPKRAWEHEIGERIVENGHSVGCVVGMMDHPDRPITYMLIESDVGEYTIYACQTDARGGCWLPRNIPPVVLYQLLFDVFVGCDLPRPISGSVTRRSPVTEMARSPEKFGKKPKKKRRGATCRRRTSKKKTS